MCVRVSGTGWAHGMKMCVGLLEMGSLCHPQASKGIKTAPCGGKRRPAAKELVASDSEIEEVGATTAPIAAGWEYQDVPEDKLSDSETKFGAVENDKIEAGAVTPI